MRWVLPPSPPAGATVVAPPRCWVLLPLLLLRYGDVEPHPGPMRVALADVTSLRLHWHTVTNWRVHVVLISKTRLTAVPRQVMRAQAGASGGKLYGGRPWSPGGGGGIWDAPPGGWGS